LFANARLTAVHGKGKYYFTRHGGNNSDVATKHKLLNPEQMEEYLSAFRERTEYLSTIMPNLKDFALWSEWSYMISMVEKIYRYELKNCDVVLARMMCELEQNRNEFMDSPWTQGFEKQWIGQYVL
jgi:isopentenyldiphosphate isomerase